MTRVLLPRGNDATNKPPRRPIFKNTKTSRCRGTSPFLFQPLHGVGYALRAGSALSGRVFACFFNPFQFLHFFSNKRGRPFRRPVELILSTNYHTVSWYLIMILVEARLNSIHCHDLSGAPTNTQRRAHPYLIWHIKNRSATAAAAAADAASALETILSWSFMRPRACDGAAPMAETRWPN